jgi:hypothetical protein
MSATLVAGEPRQVGERWIIPVSSVIRAQPSPRWVFLGYVPEAVLVVGHDGTRALALDGTELAVADLCDRVPGLAAIVASVLYPPPR